MIDLKKLREENKRRLLGINEDAKAPYTKRDIADNPEACWDIISMVCRKKTTEVKSKTGRLSVRKTNEFAFPELTDVKVVGVRGTKTKSAKNDTVDRTNIDTMEEMYQIRNAMNRHSIDDVDDTYIEFFTSVVEVLDGYAIKVVGDMVASDEEFLDKVNKARGCE